jgi:hypothetical protein
MPKAGLLVVMPVMVKQMDGRRWCALAPLVGVCAYGRTKAAAERNLDQGIHQWAAEAPSPQALMAYMDKNEIAYRRFTSDESTIADIVGTQSRQEPMELPIPNLSDVPSLRHEALTQREVMVAV